MDEGEDHTFHPSCLGIPCMIPHLSFGWKGWLHCCDCSMIDPKPISALTYWESVEEHPWQLSMRGRHHMGIQHWAQSKLVVLLIAGVAFDCIWQSTSRDWL
jgi:hypothetical protein